MAFIVELEVKPNVPFYKVSPFTFNWTFEDKDCIDAECFFQTVKYYTTFTCNLRILVGIKRGLPNHEEQQLRAEIGQLKAYPACIHLVDKFIQRGEMVHVKVFVNEQ